MQIEDMTTAEIEAYLQERKSRKGELGGVTKRADEMRLGETGWLKIKKESFGLSTFIAEDNPKDSFTLLHNTLIEANVPEQRRARRRMTVGEAVEQLKVGQEVCVRAAIIEINPELKRPLWVNFMGYGLKLNPEVEIEVDA